MIFYYSATGNSKYVAKKVQERFGGNLIDMAAAVRKKNYEHAFVEGETAVFVFPVYFAGLPATVAEFINKLEIKGEQPEICGICTFGGIAGGVDRRFRKAFKAKGISVRAFYDVKMPENCIFVFNPPIREAALMTLKRSDARIKDVLDSMAFNHRKPYRSGPLDWFVSAVEGPLYGPSCGTKKFTVDDRCIGCGLCQTVCPVAAIEMEDGRPVWTKAKCDHCAGCIMRCPVEAIQYGRSTKKRFRYVHPDI